MLENYLFNQEIHLQMVVYPLSCYFLGCIYIYIIWANYYNSKSWIQVIIEPFPCFSPPFIPNRRWMVAMKFAQVVNTENCLKRHGTYPLCVTWKRKQAMKTDVRILALGPLKGNKTSPCEMSRFPFKYDTFPGMSLIWISRKLTQTNSSFHDCSWRSKTPWNYQSSAVWKKNWALQSNDTCLLETGGPKKNSLTSGAQIFFWFPHGCSWAFDVKFQLRRLRTWNEAVLSLLEMKSFRTDIWWMFLFTVDLECILTKLKGIFSRSVS